MAVEGGVDRGHVRGAVGEVPVVVVGGQVLHVAGVGRTAAAPLDALVPVADRCRAQVGEAGGDLEVGVEVAGQVAVEQVPHRLGVDQPGAVDLAVAGSAAGAAVGVEPVDVDRGVGGVLGEVDVADAVARRAADARVAVAAARAAEQEPAAQARLVDPQGGVDVGDALAGVGDDAVGVVVVQPVAPLVVEHPGQLAGVVATAAGTVEVDVRTAPEGVAGQIDVHVGQQLLLQPGVVGELAAGHLLDPVELVEAGARGVGVAGGVTGGDRAVDTAAGAEVEVAGAAFVDGAAVVVDPHELAGEVGGDAAVDAVEQVAAGVGEQGRGARVRALEAAAGAPRVAAAHRVLPAAVAAAVAVVRVPALDAPAVRGAGQAVLTAARLADAVAAGRGGQVGEGHRPAGLLHALGTDAVVALGVDPTAHPPGGGVEIGVGERQQGAVGGVHQTLPMPVVAGEAGADHPGQPVVVAAADRGELAGLAPHGRQEDQRGLAPEAVDGGGAEMPVDHRHRVVHLQPRRGGGVDVAPPVGAEEDQVAVVDHRRQIAVADRDASDHPRREDLHQLAAAVDRHPAGPGQLGDVDAELGMANRQIGLQDVPRQPSQGGAVGGRRRPRQIAPGEVVAHPAAGKERLGGQQRPPATAPEVVEGSSGVARSERRSPDRPAVVANDGSSEAGCKASSIIRSGVAEGLVGQRRGFVGNHQGLQGCRAGQGQGGGDQGEARSSSDSTHRHSSIGSSGARDRSGRDARCDPGAEVREVSEISTPALKPTVRRAAGSGTAGRDGPGGPPGDRPLPPGGRRATPRPLVTAREAWHAWPPGAAQANGRGDGGR